MTESYGLVRDASRRVLGFRPFDSQIFGAFVLNEGKVAEMRTGEGKSLVAVISSYINSLSGGGVLVVTVNDYLARRDAEWVGLLHLFLGNDVGLIQAGMWPKRRKCSYGASVTYITSSQLGFDFLRDSLSVWKTDVVQRQISFCIVDEVDSVLVDEARCPLVISGFGSFSNSKYSKADKIARAMVRYVHYTVDEKQRSIVITEEGYEAAEDILQVQDLYDPRNHWTSYLINALKAKELFEVNVNYILRKGEVLIVDEFSGRTMLGRRWEGGLHQAIETKEGLCVQEERINVASISFQNLFRGMPQISGMSGTAYCEASEFSSIYNLSVEVLPSNRNFFRRDNSDFIFSGTRSKWNAVLTDSFRLHLLGRPVLVGTTSLSQSEELACMFESERMPFQLLNARLSHIEKESEIVSQCGRKGIVSVSTNMAGRGTDIILGGSSHILSRLKFRDTSIRKISQSCSVNETLPFSLVSNPAVFPRDYLQTNSNVFNYNVFLSSSLVALLHRL